MPRLRFSARRLGLGACGLFMAVGLLFAWRTLVSADSLSFSGTVLTPSGAAYTEGGGVNLYGPSGANAGIDGEGRFAITGLQPGTYTLDVGLNSSSSYANPAQQQITITANISGFTIQVASPAIIGTLATPSGTPTTGCVSVQNATHTLNRSACPGDDGRFKLGALEAGTYVFTTSPPDNSPYVGNDQSVTITNPATALDLGTVKLENPFIVGKVALPDGTLLTWNDDWSRRLHLSVDLWNADQTVNKHSNFDSASKFKFGRIPAGTYSLHINIWDTTEYTGSETVTLTVPSGGLDMTASPVRLSTPQLVGVIYRPDGLTPVQNVWVNLRNDDGSLNQGSSTDSLGQYRIGGLPAGTYQLEVNPPQDMSDVVRPDPVSVTISSTLTTRNVTLSAAKKFVSGTVKKADGRGVACAQVNANRVGGTGWASAATKSDGSFTLTLQPGTWGLRVERSYDFSCLSPDWIYLEGDVVVDFATSAATETQNVNFTVQKATAVITGKVLTKDGRAITQGNVNANSQTRDGQNRWSNAQINSDGTYRLNLVGATYDVNVWTNDQRLFTRNQKIAVSDNQTVTANFVMNEKLATIKGRVTDKSGNPLANIQLNGNLDCGPDGCSAWSNTTTASDGTYSLAVTAGRWFINIDAGRGQRYVYDGPQKDIFVATETAIETGVDFALTYADVTVKGRTVSTTGSVLSNISGWVYLRPATVTAGAGFREFGGSLNQGTFNFNVPSSVYSQAEIGLHTPPNSQFSSQPGQTITLVADATVEKNLIVVQNDSAIVGRVIDPSGLPLKTCNFRGEVYANTPNNWFGTQVDREDCTFSISLLAGTYNVGYHFEESAGFMNRPSNKQLVVSAGTRAQYDIKALAGDARINVLVLKPDGTLAGRTWLWADNHEEIDEQRRQGESDQQRSDAFRGPGGTTSVRELLKYCAKGENEQECRDFKLPPGSEGPGSCKDALACTKYCAKNKNECDKFFSQDPSAGPVSGPQSQSVAARRSRVSALRLVTAQSQEGEEQDPFEDMLSSGGETNDKGVATLSLLSGHVYSLSAGLPPESDLLPPKSQTVDLRTVKSAQATLVLRESDGSMSGFVTWNKVAVRNGWVGCWSEDGSSNGSPIVNGTYRLNYSFNTTYHCNANASDGTTFLRSGDQIISIGTRKSVTQHFTMDEAGFTLPPPVSDSFDATQPHVITLGDGTSVNIPANTIASSGTVTVNANPTINIQSQVTAKPIGYGYSFEAKDENNKTISTFNGNLTMTFCYTDQQLTEAGIDEDSLVPSYWDSSSGTWKRPTNITQDKDANCITTTTNHFTAYAVVSSGGKAAQNLVSVSTRKVKGNRTLVVIGNGKQAKTIEPFKGYRGAVQVQTFKAGAKAGQVIVVTTASATAGPTVVKVFSTDGKLRQTLQPWGAGYRSGVGALETADLTRDSFDDLVLAPKSGGRVRVYDLSRRRDYTVALAGNGVRIASLDFGRGGKQLVTAVGQALRVWQLGSRGFSATSFDSRRLRVTAQGIERVILQPAIRSVTPASVGRKKAVTLTIRGENLGSGSRVLIDGTLPAKKVTATGEELLTVTINTSGLKRGRHDVQVINADGAQMTTRSLTVK